MGFALQSFKSTGKDVQSRSVVISNYPNIESCLQAIYLWALQRSYERYEECYLILFGRQFKRVIDVDHKRFKNYGVYYGERNPLTTEKEKCSLKD